MHEAGHSKPVLCDNPEGWDWELGGRGIQNGEHMHIRGIFMSMYGKTNSILESKINKLINLKNK